MIHDRELYNDTIINTKPIYEKQRYYDFKMKEINNIIDNTILEVELNYVRLRHNLTHTEESYKH